MPDAGADQADAGATNSGAIEYEGTLYYSGDVDGPCEVDMQVIPSDGAQPTYEGTWCGYDADSVIGFSFGG